VISRWMFTSASTCGEMVGQMTDWYNPDLLQECKVWMGLDHTPHRIEASSLYKCFGLSNGTTKYRMKICCPGKLTVQLKCRYC